MPGKLVVVVALLALTVLSSLLTGALVSAAIQAALLFGVLIGNDGVRTFLRGLAAVNILIVVVMSIPALGASTGGALFALFCLSVASNGFVIWALGQQDVRDWMFRKNFKLGDGGDDEIPKL